MNIELIAIRLHRPLREEEWERMLPLVPPRRRQRLENRRNPQLGQEAVFAYAALANRLRELYGWETLPEMVYNCYDKPEFRDYPEVQFNISHTRGAALVGIHNEAIGVDIERLRPVRPEIMKRLLNTDEVSAFFLRWVQRESQGKRRGTGVVSTWHDEIVPIAGERFEWIEMFPGYVACVCTCATSCSIDVEKIVIDDNDTSWNVSHLKRG